MLDQIAEIQEAPYTEEDAEWDEFVARHPHGSLLQSTHWARLKNRFGWQSHRVWLRRDGKLVAGAQMLIRSAALGLIRIAYVPHGPLVDWSDEEQVGVMLNQLDFAAYEQRAGILKIEPLIWQEEIAPETWQALCLEQGCLANSDTIQPPRTIIIDLRPSEDEILAAMKQKTRYNIRLSERKGVVVRQGTAADIPTFNRLMHTTGNRNEFGVHEPRYYLSAFEIFAPEHAALFIAEFEEQPLAAIMAFAYGPRAAYLYGASSNEERQRMPTYAIQWAAIKWAKAHGCLEYDLWGVPDYPEEELEAKFKEYNEGLWGVYRFKRGFGGQIKRTVGTADRVYNKLVHRIYNWRRSRYPATAISMNDSDKYRRSVFRPEPSAEKWHQALSALPNPHPLQSRPWGDFKSRWGWSATPLLLDIGQEPGELPPLAAALVLKRQVPRLPFSILYVPKGPILDYKDAALRRVVLAQLEQHARREKAIFVKIDPDVVRGWGETEERLSPIGAKFLEELKSRGWRFSDDQIQFRNTVELDLDQPEEDLLAAMKQKTRYNIRLAGRKDVTVRLGDPSDFPTIVAMYQETAQRDGFTIRPATYYFDAWQTLYDAGLAQPLLAEYQGQTLGAVIIVRHGEKAIYMYGASTNHERRRMPNYLLQWEAIRWARQQGCLTYDFWGAPDHFTEEDPLWGVWRFKAGFNPRVVRHIGAWDYPARPFWYWLYTGIMPKYLEFLRSRGSDGEDDLT